MKWIIEMQGQLMLRSHNSFLCSLKTTLPMRPSGMIASARRHGHLCPQQLRARLLRFHRVHRNVMTPKPHSDRRQAPGEELAHALG